MHAIQLTSEALGRESGPGCRTKRKTGALDLPAFGVHLRKAALTAADWHIETLVAEPKQNPDPDKFQTWWWRHLAIGIADPTGCTVIWHGWYFLTFTPGSRKICSILLQEADDPILDLFDGRVSRKDRLANARTALRRVWKGRSTAIDRLGSLLEND